MVTHNVIQEVIGRVPHGLFLVTAAFEDVRTGILTSHVQICCEDPFLVMVSIQRGTPVEPLLRDSRCFALCRIGEEDRLVQRRFEQPPQRGDDPYVALPTSAAITGAPIIQRAEFFMDCELVGHIAPEADCRIYLGMVKAVGVISDPGADLQYSLLETADTNGNGQAVHTK